MIGDDTAPVAELGFCDSKSGKAGCTGERHVREFNGYKFCDKCYPHRKRLVKQLNAERKRNNGFR